jgi:hypothetical protein
MHIICTQPNQKEDYQTIFEHLEYVYYKQNDSYLASHRLLDGSDLTGHDTPADSLDHL